MLTVVCRCVEITISADAIRGMGSGCCGHLLIDGFASYRFLCRCRTVSLGGDAGDADACGLAGAALVEREADSNPDNRESRGRLQHLAIGLADPPFRQCDSDLAQDLSRQ